MGKFSKLIIIISTVAFTGCAKSDVSEPIIMLNADTVSVHYRTAPFIEPGFDVIDDYSCNLLDDMQVSGFVDVNRYGNYELLYSVSDEAGNVATANRQVDVILPLNDYYFIDWNAYDTCTSGNYFYTGLIQDCDCPDQVVTVGNISNFGLSAVFNLPISGEFNQFITLDTTKAAVTFFGLGTMSPAADTLYWNYIISDSISLDACRSVWIKQ